MMARLPALAPLLSLLLLLAGCGWGARRPWQGLTPEKYARLEERRLLGIALLENGKKAEAAQEFQAIRREEPHLAFGYVNEAAALAREAARAPELVETARKGAELLPKAAWPRVVLAQVYRTANRADEAGAALEAALKLEPERARVVGAFIKHLEATPGDHDARLYELRKELARLAPGNLAAQAHWLQAQVERREHAPALETVGAIQKLLPRVPESSREYLDAARAGLAAGTDEGLTAARILVNTLKGVTLFNPDQNRVYGNDQDPADYLMRDWGVPPPAVGVPAPAPVTVTWEDVTAAGGLDQVRVRGLAPAAVGDLDLAPDAGKRTGGEVNSIQGRPDLILGPSPLGLLVGSDEGFQPGIGGVAAEASPILADLNNDYALDLYAAAPEGDAVWSNPRGGTLGDAGLVFPPARGQPMRRAASTPGRGPGTALAMDADQDGDLDIMRVSGAAGQPAVRYLRNNGNFTFTDLTAPAGLNIPSGGARQAAFADFDADGDPDLFVARAGGAPLLYLNRRQDLFTAAGPEWGIRQDAGSLSAAVADFDRDGDWDVAVAGRAPHGSLLYRNGGGKFAAEPEGLPLPAGFEAEWVAVLDFDNDTWLDVAAAGRGGLRLLRNDGGRLVDGGEVAAAPARWVRALDYDQDGGMDLLAALADGALRLYRNVGASERPWMKVELQGYVAQGGREANNTYALGAEAEARTAWDTQKLLITEPQTHVGLGAASKVIALRVLWPHGVPDNAIGPQTGRAIHYVQAPRDSCPYLYTWDGERWRFATDINWRSPLGMLAGRGRPVPHDQTRDWVRIPGERLQPLGDFYHLIATEELREVNYFDQMLLAAVDHPAETEIYVDERFRFGPPEPMRIHTVRRPRLPASARDEAGKDLLPALRAVDNVFTPVPPGPFRGVGAPHDLVLDLGEVPDPSRVKLFLHGWIYPPPNSVNIAASQNPEVRILPPTLSFGDGRGGWTGDDSTVGMPCGKRKTIVLDLGGRFTGRDFRVKLSTTMEIRWDAAYFTSGEADAPYRLTELAPADADLRERGYGARYWEAPDGPDLRNYHRLLPPDLAPNWAPIPGAYTRLGPCAPLLRSVDDRYAIIGPGDEIRMSFDARKLPPLPPGWKRDFLFITDGWTKDTDNNTVTCQTVGPLPFHGMRRYPYGPDERFPDPAGRRAWEREWNTRVK